MFKHLYSTSPAGIGDLGTLYAARNAIDARQVSKDPKKNFYATADLLQKFTEATLVAGAVSYFSMGNMHGEPTLNVYNGDKQDKKSAQLYIKTVTENFVAKHILPDVPVPRISEPSPQHVQCPECGRNYQRKGFLIRHRRSVHGFTEETAPVATNDDRPVEQDYVYNYTQCSLTLGLIRLNQDDAIRHGDGARLVRLYKLMYLYYKISGCPKYAYGTLELLAQVQWLLSPRMSYRLTWNRFANSQGFLHTNLPLDLDVEHNNKLFKNDIHTYRGELTDTTIHRVSRSLDISDAVIKSYAKCTGISMPSGQHTDVDFSADVALLTEQFCEAKIFDFTPGRRHNAFQDIQSNPLANLDMTNFHKWLKESLYTFSIKHYYH